MNKCQFCNRYINTTEHHIFNGASREVSEYYGLKINLCSKCHNFAHGKFESQKDYRADYKEYYKAQFLKILDINNIDKLNEIMNKSRKSWNTLEHTYMRGLKNKLFKESVKNV